MLVQREKTYTVQEAADILEVSIYTIREYIKSGNLQAIKVGRSYKITEESLNEVLLHGTTRPITKKARLGA